MRQQLLRWLARREYSRFELSSKLAQAGYPDAEINFLLDEFAQAGWQSDERFADLYVRSKIAAGFGPRRIVHELQSRGISAELIERHTSRDKEYWWDIMREVAKKKYKNCMNGSKLTVKDQMRCCRFLLQRGFDPMQVNDFIKSKRCSNEMDE